MDRLLRELTDLPWETYAFAGAIAILAAGVLGAVLGSAGRVPMLPSAVVAAAFPIFGILLLAIVTGFRRRAGYADSYVWEPRGTQPVSRGPVVRTAMIVVLAALLTALIATLFVDVLELHIPSVGTERYRGLEHGFWQYLALTGAALIAAGLLYGLRRPLWAAAIATAVGGGWLLIVVLMWASIDTILSAVGTAGEIGSFGIWLAGLAGIETNADIQAIAADLAGAQIVPAPGLWITVGVAGGALAWGIGLILFEAAAMRWHDAAIGSRHWLLT